MADSASKLIFEKQWIHLLSLAVLLLPVAFFSESWLWIAAWVAIAHQTFVWFCWRTELHLSLLTRIFGTSAFSIYAAVFSVLGLARAVPIVILAVADRDTIPLDSIVLQSLGILLVVPSLYLFYSVGRYFGFRRAFGIDHFDASYRNLPRVRKGIFRLTSNGMYTFGFLILWIPGLWFSSATALCAAFFSHLYIWVHYFATERPDMNRIYGIDKGGKTL
jgi:protein-S-isoprenylcysteine O-methyltransferase Ste14